MNTDFEFSNFRILVVDDNPSIHEDFRKILCPPRSREEDALADMLEEVLGDARSRKINGSFEMDSAFQGEEALAKVQAAEQRGRPYSLAFVDVRMPPGWDGVETIQRIWKEHPHLQVVICTAYSDYSWEEILSRLGMTDNLVILKKPFDNVEALQLAHALTQKWQLTRKANARMATLDEMVKQRTEDLLESNRQLQGEIQRRSVIEAALRESEDRFRRAFETVSVPLSIRALDTGNYLDINQSFAQLSGYGKPEILAKTPSDLNLIVDPALHAELLRDVADAKKVRNSEIAIRRKDGQVRHVLVSIETLMLGEQACLLAALEDITERKDLEIQLRQSQKMEAVGRLAAGVAHDFNNLLTVIQGYSSLQLAKKSLEADTTKAFEQVKMASERASALTHQLLAFSRRQVVQRKPLELAAAISRIKSLLSHILGDTIRFELRLEPSLPHILADETNLEQVIMNLVINARDAMPKGGVLSLSTGLTNVSAAQAAGQPDKREGRFAVLTVADTGCGMDKQTLSRIFEPFFTTKPLGHGTGLGLSTAYGIIKQHQGWVEVESEPGRGTTFRVFLPTADQHAEPPTVDSPDSPRGASSQCAGFVLVVDELEVRRFVATTLVQEGYRVLQAASGAEALLNWKDVGEGAKLLLTDIALPAGISGTALVKHLLRRHPELKVIYTSSHPHEKAVDGQALQEGGNYLSKPLTRERLLAAVRGAFSSHPCPPALRRDTSQPR